MNVFIPASEAALIAAEKRTLECRNERFAMLRTVARYKGINGGYPQCARCILHDLQVLVGKLYATSGLVQHCLALFPPGSGYWLAHSSICIRKRQGFAGSGEVF
jgi:hypothetical protein